MLKKVFEKMSPGQLIFTTGAIAGIGIANAVCIVKNTVQIFKGLK